MRNPANVVMIIGLALGGVFGVAGTFVAQRNLQAAAWGLDGVALVVATALLALKFFRKGNDLAASVPSFAAGTALWSAALLLTSIPQGFASWTRLAGIIGAILFAVTSARIFWGEQVLPTSSPLPFFAYPFLVLTFAGWIWNVSKEDSRTSTASILRTRQ